MFRSSRDFSPRRRRWLLLLLATFTLALPSSAQEWTRFRGPNGTGLSAAKNLSAQFSASDYNWRVALPGGGHSSPVLWGKKIFLTSAEEDKRKRHLLCLSATNGKLLWMQSENITPYGMHEFNTSASATPVVDADRVYTLWPAADSFLVVARTHNGKEVWRRDLGKFSSQNGGAASPILHDGLLLFGMEPDNGEGGLFALDCRTGETRWKHTRPSKSAAYSAPFIYRPKGGSGPAQVVFSSESHGITSLDPKTGKVNWEAGGVFRARCVFSLIQVGELIFAGAGSGFGNMHSVAVRPGANGAKAEVAYRIGKGAPYVPTPVVVGNNLFLWGDNGIVTCVKGDTGETVWQERAGGNYFGSPVCVGGKLYAMSTKGELVVIAAGPVFKVLGRTDLGEPSHATPAVADGVLYLRTRSHLSSVGGGASAKKKASATSAAAR